MYRNGFSIWRKVGILLGVLVFSVAMGGVGTFSSGTLIDFYEKVLQQVETVVLNDQSRYSEISQGPPAGSVSTHTASSTSAHVRGEDVSVDPTEQLPHTSATALRQITTTNPLTWNDLALGLIALRHLTVDQGGTTRTIIERSVGDTADNLTTSISEVSSTLTTYQTAQEAAITTATLTVSGDTTIDGTLTAGSLAVAGISSGGAITAPYFTATSTTATTTLAGHLTTGGTVTFSALTSGLLYANGAGQLSASSTISSSLVEDVYLRNDGDDTTTGLLTTGGFTTTGTSSLATTTISGNLGIGITPHSSLLAHFYATGGIEAIQRIESTGGAGMATLQFRAGSHDLGLRLNRADNLFSISQQAGGGDNISILLDATSAGTGGSQLFLARAGNVGIGDLTPASIFTVGDGDLFQVNSSGAIAAATGITSSGAVTFSGLADGVVQATGGVLSATTTISSTVIEDAYVLNTGDSISGNLTFSGTAANIALGSNYLSGDGDDEGIFVDASGNVGIGTTTLSSRLTINGTNNISGGITLESSVPRLALYGEGSAASTIQTLQSAGVLAFKDYAGTTQVRIEPGGDVGINGRLAIGANYYTLNPPSNGLLVEGSVQIGTTTGGARLAVQTNHALTDALNLLDVDGIEIFTVLESGNVGIGDTTPASLLTVGASDAFQVNSSGRVLANAGASGAGNLAYSFVGDTDTGIYRSAADTIKIQTGGSDRVTFSTSQVTISNTNEDKFQLSTTANVIGEENNILFSYNNGSAQGAKIGAIYEGSWRFGLHFGTRESSGGGIVERMRIANNGNVGIGTTTPAAKLDIQEAAQNSLGLRVTDGTSGLFAVPNLGANGFNNLSEAGDIGLIFSGGGTADTASGLVIAPHDSSGEMGIRLSTDGGSAMTTSIMGGNVGIGTTTPSAKLTVKATGINSSGFRITDGTAGLFVVPKLSVNAYNSLSEANDMGIFFSGGGAVDTPSGLVIAPHDGSEMGIRLSTDGGSTMTTAIMGGNVGIGTTTPVAKLSVSGDIYADGNLTVSGITATTSISSPYFTATDANATSTFAGGLNVASGGLVYDRATGNVGVGIASPQDKLDVNGIISSGYTGGNGELRTYQNGTQDGIHVALKTNTTTKKSGLYRSNVNDFFVYYDTQNGNAVLNSDFSNSKAVIDGKVAVQFNIDGTEYMRMISSGNLGIGDTTPASLLTVGASDAFQVTSAGRVLANAGASGAGNLAYSFVGDTDTGLYRAASDEMRFQTNGADRLTITSAGSVGIGTTTPTHALEIINQTNGNLLVLERDTANAHDGRLEIISSGGVYGIRNAFVSDRDLGFRAAATGGYQMVLLSDGNVGIGTTTPESKLSVVGRARLQEGDYGGDYSFNGSADTLALINSAHGGLTIATPNTSNANIYFADPESSAVGSIRYSHTVNALRFFTNGGAEERMIIDADGNVGIGTTTPSYPLVVSTSGNLPASFLSTTNRSVLNIEDDDSQFRLGAEDGYAFFGGTGALSTAKVVINLSSGNVGIGDISPAAMLTVGTSDVFQVTSAGRVLANAGASGAGNLAYSFVGDTDTGLYRSAADEIRFQTNGADTFTLTSGGNVGIGTTTPANTLHVERDQSDIADDTPLVLLHTTGTAAVNKGGLLQLLTTRGGGTPDTNLFNITNADGTRFSVRNDGWVGIGTDSPEGELHIYRDAPKFFVEDSQNGGEWVRFSAGTVGSSMKFSNTGFFAVGPVATKGDTSAIDDFYMASTGRVGINTDTTNARLSVQSDGTADILNLFETGGTEVLTVLESGSVGIGTAGPGAKLTINQSSNATQTNFTQDVANAGLLIETNYIANNYTPGIFWSTSNNQPTKPKAGIYLQEMGNGSIMHFGTSNNYGTGITNSALVINQSGDVLINEDLAVGTTAPKTKLTINQASNATQTAFTQDVANAGLLIETNYAANNYTPGIFWSGGGSKPKAGIYLQDTGSGSIMHFGTSNSYGTGITNSAIVIDQSGEVGIGTAAPGRLLHVNGGTADATRIRLSETGDTSDSHISGLEFYDGATQKWRFGKTGSSHDFRIITGANYQALSILQSNGAVGLGTTTPVQTLTVIGDGSFNNTHGDITGVAYGLQSVMEYTPTSSGTGIAVGATGKVSYTGSSVDISGAGHIVGSMGWAVADSAGQTAALIIGSEGKLDVAAGTVTNAVSTESQLASNTGTITNWFGNHAHVASNAGTIDLALATALKISNNSSTITTAAGVAVLNPESNTGTISNLIGLFYPDISSGGVSNKYLILNQDDDAFLSHAGGSSLMGAVAIGALSGNAKLDVQGSGTSTATFGLAVRNGDGAYAFAVRDDGNVGVNTVTPGQKFVVNGTVGFSALTGSTGAGSLCLSAGGEVVYNATSDSCLPSLRETKDEIEPLTLSALDTISALESVSFSYINSDGRTRYGFIAEDVADVDALLATYDADGILSGIDDRSMLAVLVKGVQEVWETIQGFSVLFTTEKVQTDELCVGDICVNESELEQLLNQSNIAPSTAGDTAAEDEPEQDADGEAPEQVGGGTPEPVEGDAVDPTDEEAPAVGEGGVEQSDDAPQENNEEEEVVESEPADSNDADSDASEPVDDAATQDDAGQGEG